MKKYRVEVTMTEYGYVEVEASADADEADIRTLADEECNNGGFVGVNSEGIIGDIIKQ